MSTNYQLKDLALKAGVSESTVSRILNGVADKYRIGKETQARVLQLANEHNYKPNQLARSLRLQKTNTLGLIIPDITNPFFSGIAHCIEQEARSRGYFVILSVSEEDSKLEQIAIEQLSSRKIDGIIISPVGNHKEHLQILNQSNIPMVLIDRYFDDEPWPYVSSDNRQGGYLATEYLIQNGHRKIACIQGTAFTTTNTNRVLGYMQALADFNIPFDKRLLIGNHFDKDNGYKAMQHLLTLPDEVKPTGILALSNLISLGVLEALQDKKLRIPDNYSLLAFDEQPYSSLLATPMTTIEQNVEEICAKALHFIINKIENPQQSESLQVNIETTINKRESVKNITRI